MPDIKDPFEDKQPAKAQKQVFFPEIIKKTELLTQQEKRLGQVDILPTQIVDRLLGTGAVVLHALNSTLVHSGAISDAQHGARGVIVGAHGASTISNTPAGSIVATDVQAAINELDGDKSATSHNHDHATLTNLNSASYTHLTSANHTDLTDGGDTTLHVHNIYALLTGATFSGNVTFTGRAILPMGEISYFDMTGTAVTITTQSDGSTNMVVVPVVTTLANDSGFDNGGSNNGRLRYTGATTKMFHVACSVSFSGGNADTFVIGIAKSGTVIASSKLLRKMGAGGDVGSTALHVMVELATNNYLEVYVGNTTDADDPTFHSINLFAMGM